ncbi:MULTISPECIES: alpha/beta hydrolase [Flavobacteriaceae]|uniref:alpha/beta hydrolase n=1 Tax=Flavobacteriaceae TaxID=49546 RepID=UPI0014924764|nr:MULTISPECIES: alpha/beta hydrolase [Allomuricauda]MDC6365925.1 alpha/beta hydrolase [Muricauda sp. AC10]
MRGQNSPQPYSIVTTYKKLKKDFPFVKMIEPLESDKIISYPNIAYKSSEKGDLVGDIYMPRMPKKLRMTAILLVHGGGWLTGSKENQTVMAQHLAEHGYVAMTINYTLGHEEPYPSAVIDLKDAVRWLRAHAETYHIDSKRIVILGTSAGAQLATLVGVTPNSKVYGFDPNISDEVQAIINIDGIVSFVHPEAHQEGKSASIWLNGTRETNPKNWKEASPLQYVDSNAPPILFINSSRKRFHAGRDDMIQILNEKGIYNQVHTLKDSPHSFWLLHPWFEPTLNYILDFLDSQGFK